MPCVKSLRPLIDPSTVCSTFDKGLKRISIDAADKDCLKISKFTELKGDASELKEVRILLQKIREILPRRFEWWGAQTSPNVMTLLTQTIIFHILMK